MKFRTTFAIDPSPVKITYKDPVMFIGSCFASSIGEQMEIGRMPVMINPAGAVYNPVSVYDNIEMIIRNKVFTSDDLFNNNGTYLSFSHNTEFSSWDPGIALKSINEKSKKAHEFLASARFLFITFGTARIYRLQANKKIVSNCHKLPSDFFSPGLLSVDEIVSLWSELLNRLNGLYPELKVVFTISPVRHWKDGAHGNQISKSVLFLAVDELLKHNSSPGYLPAYELVMDDLRDYRFYDDDMLHPSSEAIMYIWEAFASAYIDSNTFENRKEVVKITKAMEHHLLTDSPSGVAKFAGKMLAKIEAISVKMPAIDLTSEKNYFLAMLK